MLNALHLIHAVFRREQKRFFASPTYRTTMLWLPMLSMLFFVVLFGSGVVRKLPVAVIDQDQTPLSREMTRLIDQAPATHIVAMPCSTDEGKTLLFRGKVRAVVVLPDGFARRIARQEQAKVEAYISGTNFTSNGLISKAIQTAVGTFSAQIAASRLLRQGKTSSQVQASIQPIAPERHVLFNPYLNYAWYLAPTFLAMMLLIFVTVGSIYALGVELRQATASEWLATAQGNIFAALGGKMLFGLMLFGGVALWGGWLLFGVEALPMHGNWFWVVFSTLLLILSYQVIGMMLVALTANLRLALSLGGGYAVLAFSFSGLTFPSIAMWKPIAFLTHLFPLTTYTRMMIDQCFRGTDTTQTLGNTTILLLFIGLPLWSIKRLKQVASDPRFYGQN